MLGSAYGDSFAAKRIRKLVQRRAVDYTCTAVRYLQVLLHGYAFVNLYFCFVILYFKLKELLNAIFYFFSWMSVSGPLLII